MLMMLGVLKGAMVKPGPVDAHDAGDFSGAMVKPGPADAHDAGGFAGPCMEQVQLMLMMLGVLRVPW